MKLIFLYGPPADTDRPIRHAPDDQLRKAAVTKAGTIYAVVRKIPRGKVATYGQVARLAGLPRRARLVGYALGALENDRAVPWHRVINAQGKISGRSEPMFEDEQRGRLEREGVVFGASGRIALARFQWKA